MKSMLIVFFILVFLLMIMFFPFKIRLMSHVNLITAKCFYCFKFWRLKFLCGKIVLNENGKIEMHNSNNLLSGEYDKVFVSELSKQFLKRLDVKKMELFFTGGFVEDSYASAILCGTISSFVQTLYSFLSQRYENVKMFEDVLPTFHETNLELTFDVVVCISFFQMVLGVIKANRLKNRLLEIRNEG